jgi:tetratricopeptide (TPR) repeat protein
MKNILTILILCFVIGCKSEDCPQGINKLPMYGNQKKCEEQIKYDNDFLAECGKTFENRKIASKYHVERAWDYFYKNQLDTAMMRFNQAWLLDSLNADVYWGFGNILGIQSDFKSSIMFFEKSIQLNPDNSKVWQSISTSYGQQFFQTKDIGLLNKTIECLKKSLELDPKNTQVLGQLTGAYSYFMQKDSALRYLRMTDEIDPNMINPEVREILKDKK